MTQRILGLAPSPSAIPNADYTGLADTLAYFQQRVNDATARKYEGLAEVRQVQRLASPARQPRVAQVAFDRARGKYIVGGEEFDANDFSALDAIAQLPDAPLQRLAAGQDAFTLDEIRERRDSIRNNAEVDNRLGSIGRGMAEAVAGIPRGVAAVFGADVANPLEGSADAWRRGGGVSLREQAGRTMRPTESLVGLGQAAIQAVETGLPVLAAGALGTAVAGPFGGVAAGVGVAGGMAAESQGDGAQERLTQQFAQMTPEELSANPEYMTLRRAGNDHIAAVGELVRRGRTTAARSGFAIGGVSGALAPVASRFAGRALGLGRGAATRSDDVLGDALLRRMRGKSTGLVATARGAGFSAALGGLVEGGQEFFETDVSQGLADISAGQSDRYRVGQYGTLDDFVGGFVGGAPLGGLGGLRNPGPAPEVQPPANKPGTADPTLNAALAGVVAPQNPDSVAAVTRGLVEGDRRSIRTAEGRGTGSYPDLQPQPNQTPDLFGAAPSVVREDDPQAAAMVEMEEIQRVIPQLILDMQGISNPQARDWRGTQIDALRMRYSQLERLFGALPERTTDPNQLALLDQAGFPIQREGVDIGQTPDMFGRPATHGPSGEFDSTDVANPAGNSLARARDLMAARYGSAPLLDQSGQPVGATGPVVVPRAFRRQAEGDRFAQRYEQSYNAPAPLPDLTATEANARAAMAEERNQLERMLAERREAGFADADPVATGIEQRLEVIAQALGPRTVVEQQVTPVDAPAVEPARAAVVPAETPVDVKAPRTNRKNASATEVKTPTPPTPPKPPKPPKPPDRAPAAGVVITEVAPGQPPDVRRRILNEMLAVQQRKMAKKGATPADRELARAEIAHLSAQLAALDAAVVVPPTGGRGPSKGVDRPPSTGAGEPVGAGTPSGSPPEAADKVVQTRAEANAKAARDLAETIEAERRGDEPLDLAIVPVTTPPELRVTGLDAPVLKAAEMSVEVEGGEAQVKPSAMLDWYRKRVENLTRLLACVQK